MLEITISQAELAGAVQKCGLQPSAHSPLAHLEGYAEPGAWWYDHLRTLTILAAPKRWLPLRMNRACTSDWIQTTVAESEHGAAVLQKLRDDYQLILAESLEQALEAALSQFLKMEPLAESQELSHDAFMTLLAASDAQMVAESQTRLPAGRAVLSEALLHQQWKDGGYTLNNRSAVCAARKGPRLVPTTHTWKAGLHELESLGWLRKAPGGYQLSDTGHDYALNFYALHATIHVPDKATLYLCIDGWLVEFAGQSVLTRGGVPADLLAFASTSDPGRVCPACRQPAQPDDLFCTHCGTRCGP